MARKPSAKAAPKAATQIADPAAAMAAPAGAEQLATQPAASSTNPEPTAVTPPTSTEQPMSEAPGADAGSSGQDAQPNTDQAAASSAATTSSPAPAVPEAPVGSAAATGGSSSEQAGSVVPAATSSADGTATETDDDLELNDGEVEGLWIVAIPKQGFRRCGYRFTREGFGIALSALTPEQIETLENEPNLKVERGIFSGRHDQLVE